MTEFEFALPPPLDETVMRPVEPTFSVAIAAYQAAATIGEAIESACAQTHPPFEVIVCDDGSTDDTARELARFERIHVLTQRNLGEASAKNAATREANGNFVVFLDADDVYLPRRLEALACLVRARPDLDVLTTDALLEIDGRQVRRCYTESWKFEAADQRAAILERNFVFGLAAVRRSRLLEIGGFDESLSHATDWDCWIRLILSGSRVGLVAEPLARYRLHAASLSANRGALLAGRASVLSRAAENPALTFDERSLVMNRAATARREAHIAEAVDALVHTRENARELLLPIVHLPGFSFTTRLRATSAAAVPRLAGAFLRRRFRKRGRRGPAGLSQPES